MTAITGEYPVPAAYARRSAKATASTNPLPVQLVKYLQRSRAAIFGFSFKNQQSVGRSAPRAGDQHAVPGWHGLCDGHRRGSDPAASTAATRRLRPADGPSAPLRALAYAAPVFWVGQLLILLLAVSLKILPVAGMTSVRGVSPGPAQVWDRPAASAAAAYRVSPCLLPRFTPASCACR